MKCPACGADVNEQISRCHSCGISLVEDPMKPAQEAEEVEKATKRAIPFVPVVVYILILVLASFPLFSAYTARQKADKLRENMQAIMSAMNSYADKNGWFPDRPEQLISEEFLINFPVNPYGERPMKPRRVGEAFSGDFSYIPVFDDLGHAMGCTLVGYGPDINKGRDIFTAGHDYSHLTRFAPEPDGKPDGVIVVLQGERGEYSAGLGSLQNCRFVFLDQPFDENISSKRYNIASRETPSEQTVFA